VREPALGQYDPVRTCVAAAEELKGVTPSASSRISRGHVPCQIADYGRGRQLHRRQGGSMAVLTLYHAAPSRSSIVLWMLEEVGERYDNRLLKLSAGDNRKPDYLAINPMGKVPALRHGEVVITEVAAICTYLADAFPDKKLNVPIGTPRRGVYLKWLFFGPSCFEAAVVDRA